MPIIVLHTPEGKVEVDTANIPAELDASTKEWLAKVHSRETFVEGCRVKLNKGADLTQAELTRLLSIQLGNEDD